jgi:hypothetical protein
MSGNAPAWPTPGKPLVAGPETKTISTLGAASGQAIVIPPRPHRRWVVGGGAAFVVVGLAVLLAVIYSRQSADAGSSGAVRVTTIADAGTTISVDAAAAMSALAIISDPDGATISVNGVPKGRAPLNLQLPVGAEVEIRADMPGRDPVRRPVAVTATPATVRLELLRAVDAGSAPGALPAAPSSKGNRDAGRGDRKRAGSGAGSGSDNFNPNDVL